MAKNTFAKQEYLHLQSLSDELLQQHFYVTWTLKEAYIKARGMGLSLPLKDFSFEILTNDEMRVHFDSSLQDREQDWQFLRSRPTDTHF